MDEPIPARMLNEVVYCPRLFYLEHVAEEWEDSADTVSGRRVHRRVDLRGGALPDPEQVAASSSDDSLRWTARSVRVGSEAEGITAVVDLVEAADGSVAPVDYKRGRAPDATRVPGGVWPADRVQSVAQALALRGAGYTCNEGIVYYAASKQRVSVPVHEVSIQEVRAAVSEARRIVAGGEAPPPLLDSPKCPRCSLVGICLPDETNALLGRVEARQVRGLLPGDDDRLPCHIQANGATVTKDGGLLRIRFKDDTQQEVRLSSVSHLSIFGRVQLTPSVVQALCSEGIGASFYSSGGWYYGSLGPVATVNVATRIEQFKAHFKPDRALVFARRFVAGKILNSRTLLRRNGPDGLGQVLDGLKRLAAAAEQAGSVATLLGIEGTAARLYFGAFGKMLRDADCFTLDGRNRRPPRDPVNALLSFAYALLPKDARIALLKVGLDPAVGFLHQVRPGRPALALDLMEEFRPLVADSAVLTALNNEELRASDFVRAAGAVALGDRGRRVFLSVYERRMAQEVTHPLFGYRVSYRRLLEVQARLVARTLAGELAEYPSFLTR